MTGHPSYEELEALVYVPGLRRCAKCGLRLVTNSISAATGAMRADDSPQTCPNNCGPMWRVTEREAGNDLCDRLEAALAGREVPEGQKLGSPVGFSIKPLFAWYDLWIGAFWDGGRGRLYLLPLPCIGLVIQFPRPSHGG